MKNITLSPPELGFIVVTRAALALGVGLLVSSRLDEDRRRNLGRAFIGIGAATTIPALLLLRRSIAPTNR
jgi:hypothetical protein